MVVVRYELKICIMACQRRLRPECDYQSITIACALNSLCYEDAQVLSKYLNLVSRQARIENSSSSPAVQL